MRQEPLTVRCVYSQSGEELQALILRSLSLYLRRTLAEEGASGGAGDPSE